jgi:hypothetical protein
MENEEIKIGDTTFIYNNAYATVYVQEIIERFPTDYEMKKFEKFIFLKTEMEKLKLDTI